MPFPNGNPKLRPLDESLDEPTWIVLENCVYHSLSQKFNVVVKAGFITDLASVPRWPGASEIASGQGNSASVVHDWLYTTCELSKINSDGIFLEAMVDTNVEEWRRALMYSAVVRFGDSHYGFKRRDVKLKRTS